MLTTLIYVYNSVGQECVMHLDTNVSDHIKVNNCVFNCVRYVLLLPALWADRKKKKEMRLSVAKIFFV